MGLLAAIRRLIFGRNKLAEFERARRPQIADELLRPGRPLDDLARRLKLDVSALEVIPRDYQTFTIPKRGGGVRRIEAPNAQLKALQRRILRELLRYPRAHSAAHGFERGRSIVANAAPHVGRAVVLKMDVQEFFASTTEARVRLLFNRLGWDERVSRLLASLCTHRGRLPQGAPTSPRLSNLVNRRLDHRLNGIARRFGAVYTRYADDLTFSFAADDRAAIHGVIRSTKAALRDEGYEIHHHRKLQVRRRYERQCVTGLVVNEKVQLPRATRRWLRAVEHHLATARPATLSAGQLAGWRALQQMIARHARSANGNSRAGS